MKKILLIIYISFFIVGCSGKTQINPTESQESIFETDFYNKKKYNEALNEKFKEGEAYGYETAKKEFEKIIPYLEAIRASAELNKAGGICSGPLFLDKSDPSGIKLVLGESHICDNFTIDRIIKITKNGIPGLPDYIIKSSHVENQNLTTSNNNSISNISIVGVDKKDYFIEKPEDTKIPSKVKILNTETNRQILRESNVSVSSLEVDTNDKNRLILDFPSTEIKNNFCSKFNMCIKD